ncbi:uncharacterized protein LOC142363265 isoform X2 [Opisthocomus hoazin]|uniref:uncharacterized protein LOC142363265 isoform X2 n=1 Tax=Opisthocomus hoazin TaxID=30419 RepID=UPI003F52D45D
MRGGCPRAAGRETSSHPLRQAAGALEASRVRAAPGPEARGDKGRRRAPPSTRQRSPGPARPAQPPPAPARPLKPVPEPPASPKARGAGSTLGLECASASLNAVAAASFCVAGAAWRTCLSVPALGMPLAAPAPGLCGLCVPGLDVLAARGRKGRGGALSGCGQEVVRLKLECPEKAENEEMEGHLAGSCLALQAGESLPLRRGTAVERASERGYVPREPRLLRAARHTRFLLGGGQPSGRSYGRGREEREASEVAESPSSAESESRASAEQRVAPGAA